MRRVVISFKAAGPPGGTPADRDKEHTPGTVMPGPPATGPPRRGAPPGGENAVAHGGTIITNLHHQTSEHGGLGDHANMRPSALPDVLCAPPVPGPLPMGPPPGGPLSRGVAQPTAPPTIQMARLGVGGLPGSLKYPGLSDPSIDPPGHFTTGGSSVRSALNGGVGPLLPPASAPPQLQRLGAATSSSMGPGIIGGYPGVVSSGHVAVPSPAIASMTGSTAGFNTGLSQSIGLASGAATQQSSFVEEFSSLQLGGGGSVGDHGADPSQFPRPGDDVPVPNSEFSCDPRYLRLTVNALPANQALKQRFALPVGCMVRPLIPGEKVPVAQFGSTGIVRCRRCRTYVNPFVQFIDGGRRFRCNVCQLPNEVPVDYFCTLDANGTRRDIAERPELRHGTVEFIASQEYMVRPPMPPTYFFAFDVSANAVSSGFLMKAVDTVKETLDELPGGERTHVGFLTYDNAIHFYGLKPGSVTPQMMVVAELDDPFCPAPEDLLVNLGDSRGAVNALLDILPSAFAATSQVDSCMGPAVQAAYMAMNHIGGKLMMFQCTLPSLGQGRLLNRGDDHRNAGTDKEHLGRAPADPFFKKMAAECSRQQICVDIFATASPYGDLASLSTLCRYTGGQLYHYPGFRPERDGLKLRNELRHNLTRFTAWEAVCRVRCSKGFRVSSFNGHFFVRSMDLLALPATNADAAYAVQIAHDEQLPTGSVSYLQCALLYTTADGERRIRVHTMSVPVVPDIAQMFRSIDGGAMSAFLTRLAVERALTARLQDARETMQLKLSQSMREFRLLNTSAARAFNCLIFPDRMRLVPLFTLCAAKSAALRGQTRDVSVDERIRSIYEIMSAPTEAILRRLYPAMYALHAMPPEAGFPNEAGAVVMPPRTVMAGERVDARGAYLVDDGRQCLLWLGKMLDHGFVNAVFGAQGPPKPDVDFEPKLMQGNQLSKQVCGVIGEIRRRAANGCHCTLTVIKQGDPSEALLFPLLVEDRGAGGAGAMSYADFLILLHRQVAQAGGSR